MKILSKEEEQAHYNEAVKGGILGGVAGLGIGAAGVALASRRYDAFRHLTIQFRAFLAVSTGTFASIVSADHFSRAYERARNPENQFVDSQRSLQEQIESQKSTKQRIQDWATENRYPIVFGSWVASMGIALGLVGRNPYLTTQQKIVQARVYAQGLTIAVLLGSFALEGFDKSKGKGRWETVKVMDPNDPTHKHMIEKRIHHERYEGEDQWKDMVEAEEQRMREREEAVKRQERKDAEKGKDVKKMAGKDVHAKDHNQPSDKVKAP